MATKVTRVPGRGPGRGPFLLRPNRGLDLVRLERKPQQNLSSVYKILTSTISDVESRVVDLEKSYLGCKTIEQELRYWAVGINNVIRLSKLSGLFSLPQIEDVVKRLTQSPDLAKGLEISDLNKLKDVIYKIKDFVPTKFKDIITDLKSTLTYMEKYCLSFYDLENPIDLETAKQYEQQRQDYVRAIPLCLDSIITMWDNFKSKGLFYTDLSPNIKDLCRASAANNAAFLLVFYEACEYVRDAISLMRKWIEADTNFAKFLRNDIKEYEKELSDSVKILRDHQHKYHQLRSRIKNVKIEHDAITKEMLELQDTEDSLIVEEEMLTTEANEMQVQMELIEYSRDQLIKKAPTTDPSVLYEKYSQFSEELRTFETKLPVTKRRLTNIQNKLTWLREKRGVEQKVNQEYLEVKQQLDAVEEQKTERELEITDLQQKLELAKKICLQKTSSDAVAKIFHHQPLEANNARLPGAKGKEDPFERACLVVATNIEGDWRRLYRNLPFIPPRGEKTKDKDIEEFMQIVSRIGVPEVVIRCLDRWRRYHTRAKPEDLRATLQSIKRNDIISAVEQELNPTPPVVEAPDDVLYSYAEPHLIPFLKEVEKFDELRAANRL